MNEIILYSKGVVKRESLKNVDGEIDSAIIMDHDPERNDSSSSHDETRAFEILRPGHLSPDGLFPSLPPANL